MVDLGRWYVASNNYFFIFLFVFNSEKYGVAIHNSALSSCFPTKQDMTMKYRLLSVDEVNLSKSETIKDLYFDISPVKRFYVKKIFLNSNNFLSQFKH